MGGSDEREDVTNKTATVKMGAKNVVFQAITTAPNPFENIDFEWTFTGTNGMTALPHAVKNGQLLTFNTILRSKEQEGNYTILFGNFSASFTLDISGKQVYHTRYKVYIMSQVIPNYNNFISDQQMQTQQKLIFQYSNNRRQTLRRL